MTYEEYKPMPAQAAFHASPVKYKLYGGAMAGGKSYALCAEIIRLSQKYSGNSILLARKTQKDLKKTTLAVLLELIPQRILKFYNKSDGIIKLTNGSDIIISDLEQIHKLKSLNLGAFAIDEASETDDEAFKMLATRLRKAVEGIKYFGLLASNPEPGWLKDRFITQQLPDHKYFPALPRDNPHLPINYLRDLERELPAVWRSKYLEGSWDDFGGAVFKPEWIQPCHKLPDLAAKFTAIDPAISEDEHADETAIVTFGIGYDDKFYEVETLHGRWSFAETLSKVQSVYARHKPEMIGVETVAYQKALYEVLSRAGLPVVEVKADRDKVRRAMSVSRLFEDGKVYINTHALQQQLIEFPKGTHDDLVDACVYSLKMICSANIGGYNKPQDEFNHLNSYDRAIWESYRKEFLAGQAEIGFAGDDGLGDYV